MTIGYYRRPESVLVVVYTITGDVLLMNRRVPVFWQSVTGSLEQDEQPRDAAHRELTEETGINPDAAGVQLIDCQQHNQFEIVGAWRSRFAPGITHNLEHVFLCELENRPPSIVISPQEHSEYRWCTLGAAMLSVWSWTNRAALADLVAPRLAVNYG